MSCINNDAEARRWKTKIDRAYVDAIASSFSDACIATVGITADIYPLTALGVGMLIGDAWGGINTIVRLGMLARESISRQQLPGAPPSPQS